MSKPSSTNSPRLSYHKNGWYICRASKGVSSKRVIVTRQIRGVVQSNILRCKKQEIKVVIALGIHLFPFRTEKLSPTTSMVLRKSGRVDSRRFFRSESESSPWRKPIQFWVGFFRFRQPISHVDVRVFLKQYFCPFLLFFCLLLVWSHVPVRNAPSLEIVFLDGKFVLHDVMSDLRVMLVL